jgi:microcystin-dependent protein
VPDISPIVLGVKPGPFPAPTTILPLKSGNATNTLLISNLPPHNNSINAVSTEGNQNSPTGNLPADTKTLDKEYSNAAANTTMKTSMVGNNIHRKPLR